MWIDIERVYDMKKIKSTDNNSHMQVDKIFVDFGFITNAAYTEMWSDNEGKKRPQRFILCRSRNF